MALPLFYKVITPDFETENPPSNAPVLNILFLHGYFASYTNMIGLINHLKPYFSEPSSQQRQRVCFYLLDLRNHGNSPHSDEMTYEAMAMDVEAFAEKLNITECVVVGHSMGGKVAMTLAVRGKLAIRKLVIGDIAPYTYKEATSEKYVKELYKLDLKSFETREAVDKYLTPHIANPTLRGFFLKNLRLHRPSTASSSTETAENKDTFLYWQCNLPVLYKTLPTIKSAVPKKLAQSTPPKSPSLDNAALPLKLLVLFIRGANSSYLAETPLRSIPDYFTNYEVMTFADTGHWVHFERPAQFAAATHKFLIS